MSRHVKMSPYLDNVTGHDIHSDNHILMRKSQGTWTPLATETVSKVGVDLDGKHERNKVNELKNDKHSTCHLE